MNPPDNSLRGWLHKKLANLQQEQCRKLGRDARTESPSLDAEEFGALQNFLQEASRRVANGEVKLLYRGQRKDTLGRLLCNDPDSAIQTIASGLFYFGEKGKHFWKQGVRTQVEEREWPKILRNLNDLSEKSFDQILKEFKKVISCSADKPWVQEFLNDHPELCDAVRSNRSALVERFRELEPNAKRLVRDSYVYALHTYSRKEHKAYLPLVSTSPKYKEAVRYARNAGTDNANSDECVICVFLPERFASLVISVQTLRVRAARISELGFPPIKSGFFEQEEVAFWGGIFPHCVYGLYQPGQKIFWGNPAIWGKAPPDWAIWSNGLFIPQREFDERARRETGYASGVELLPSLLKEFEL